MGEIILMVFFFVGNVVTTMPSCWLRVCTRRRPSVWSSESEERRRCGSSGNAGPKEEGVLTGIPRGES